MSGWFDALKARAEDLRRETLALWIAYRDPRTPWYARAWAALVVAYALSPIDLVPDFIPVLGYLDDLLLVPLGIALGIRLIPPAVMADAWESAAGRSSPEPRPWLGVLLVIALWLAALAFIGYVAWGILQGARPAPAR
ncbi:MAG: DUF1232 domain-containing protein [Chloroflexi bacterium]|nr:DUF1232 domain-containing protein [Chloroflexota bacterium]